MKEYQIPSEKPEYKYVKTKKEKKARVYMAIDRIFTLYGFLLVFAYTVLLLISSLRMKLSSIPLFIAFWFVLTYIAFPRLHSFFASMYLPDYFLSRTKTGDGILGDPVNLSIIGSEEDIHAVMIQAGWTKADPITLRSSLGIILSTIKHKPYPAAPVSDLFLFNRKQNFAYQMEVDGSASRRHHVRFWKVPDGWSLPTGKKVDWLAAGTYDRGIGLTSSTLQFTHRIDQNVDKERDFIIESILYIDNDVSIDVIKEFVIPYKDENGGGDTIETDGDMPIVNLNGAFKRATDKKKNLIQEDTLKLPSENQTLNRELPPKSLIFIAVFIILKLVLSLLGLASVIYLIDEGYIIENASSVIQLIGFSIAGLINLTLFIFTLKKFKWSRLFFLVISSLSCTLEIASIISQADFGAVKLLSAGISIAIVLILSSLDIRQWVFTVKKRGQ